MRVCLRTLTQIQFGKTFHNGLLFLDKLAAIGLDVQMKLLGEKLSEAGQGFI